MKQYSTLIQNRVRIFVLSIAILATQLIFSGQTFTVFNTPKISGKYEMRLLAGNDYFTFFHVLRERNVHFLVVYKAGTKKPLYTLKFRDINEDESIDSITSYGGSELEYIIKLKGTSKKVIHLSLLKKPILKTIKVDPELKLEERKNYTEQDLSKIVDKEIILPDDVEVMTILKVKDNHNFLCRKYADSDLQNPKNNLLKPDTVFRVYHYCDGQFTSLGDNYLELFGSKNTHIKIDSAKNLSILWEQVGTRSRKTWIYDLVSRCKTSNEHESISYDTFADDPHETFYVCMLQGYGSTIINQKNCSVIAYTENQTLDIGKILKHKLNQDSKLHEYKVIDGAYEDKVTLVPQILAKNGELLFTVLIKSCEHTPKSLTKTVVAENGNRYIEVYKTPTKCGFGACKAKFKIAHLKLNSHHHFALPQNEKCSYITQINKNSQSVFIQAGEKLCRSNKDSFAEFELDKDLTVIDLSRSGKQALIAYQKKHYKCSYDLQTNKTCTISENENEFPVCISNSGKLIAGSYQIISGGEKVTATCYWEKQSHGYRLIKVPADNLKSNLARFTHISNDESVLVGQYAIGKIRRPFLYYINQKQLIVPNAFIGQESTINCLSNDGNILAGHYGRKPVVLIINPNQSKTSLNQLKAQNKVQEKNPIVHLCGEVTAMSGCGSILAGYCEENDDKTLMIWVKSHRSYKGYTIDEILELTNSKLPQGFKIVNIKWISLLGDEILADMMTQDGKKLPWKIVLNKPLVNS